MDKELIFEAKNYSLGFSRYISPFKKEILPVIRNVSLKLYKKEITAVVGASGSGKSLLAHGIMGILPRNALVSGNLIYKGTPLTPVEINKLRGSEIVLVPQSVACLDPLMKVGQQLRKSSKLAADKNRATSTLGMYGLEADTENLYPFELSGGMARRVLISTAVMESPQLVIADEPTPGLHITAAKRVLQHFREIADGGAAVLLITHDLELATRVADRVIVFYSGQAIEDAAALDFASEHTLRHPYTKALWRAMPQNGFNAINGAQPYTGDFLGGCPFIKSCLKSGDNCHGDIPYKEKNEGFVRCVNE